MNRNDFRSAYDKIVLPEDVRAEMKKKLLEQVSERDSASGGAENGGAGQAREIRLQPRKRSAGRIVAGAGSGQNEQEHADEYADITSHSLSLVFIMLRTVIFEIPQATAPKAASTAARSPGRNSTG